MKRRAETSGGNDLAVVDRQIAAGEFTRVMLGQTKSLPRLTPEEERRLARRAGRGDREARNRLAVSLLHRSVKNARRYHGSGFDDLVQAGAEALVEKVAKVAPDRLDFPIREKMAREVARMYRPAAIPRHLLSVLNALTQIWERKAQELKRLPNAADLVEDLRTAIEPRGNFRVDEKKVSFWMDLLKLPCSVGVVTNRTPDPARGEPDREPTLKKMRVLFPQIGREDDWRAVRLVFGLDDKPAVSQRRAARVLGLSQRGVGYRVARFCRQAGQDRRVQLLFRELEDLEELVIL